MYVFFGRFIVFAVGSGIENHKRWSIENYVLILNYLLNNTNYSIYFVGSNSEASFINEIINNISHNYFSRITNLVNKTSFDSLLCLFHSSDLIGTDNGIIHLANTKTYSCYF